MNCLECKKELMQTPGKRTKMFCSSTCRSNYWQKAARKNKPKIIKDLNKPTNQIKPKEAPKTNYSINTQRPFMSDAIRKKLGL